jgi:hypothetical protein
MSRTVVVPLTGLAVAGRARAFARRHPVVLKSVGEVEIFVALSGLFLIVVHPWLMNWGSTREEQA